jgi:hypothetical protein
MVRAKFKCEGIAKFNNGAHITLAPVYTGSKENEEFFNATPSGKIDLMIVNPSAAEQFKFGKEYYVDFTPTAAEGE